MDLPNQPGNQVTRKPRGKLSGYDSGLGLGDLKMRRPTHPIEHVEVIREDARIEQSTRQLGEYANVVVHATEQDRLIE